MVAKHIQHIHYYSIKDTTLWHAFNYMIHYKEEGRRERNRASNEDENGTHAGDGRESNIRTETDLQHVKEQSQSRHCPVANDREY